MATFRELDGLAMSKKRLVRPARGKKNLVTAYASPEAAEAVAARSERLGWSLAKTAGAIIEAWFAEGCPPLTELEKQATKAGGPGEAVSGERLID